MAKTKETFHIYARVYLDTSIEIKANNLEEALAESKSLKLEDFVDLLGENMDSVIKITGVYEEYNPF